MGTLARRGGVINLRRTCLRIEVGETRKGGERRKETRERERNEEKKIVLYILNCNIYIYVTIKRVC